MSDTSQEFFDTYDISPTFGFLTDPSLSPTTLPSSLCEFQQLIDAIGDQDGVTFRRRVRELAETRSSDEYTEIVQSLTNSEKLFVYTAFTFIVQKYVRCMGAQDRQIQSIPHNIGIIWYLCARPFELPNVTSYSAVILNNFTYNDRYITTPEDVIDNITPKYAITGTPDEQYFYRIHVAIEKIGSPLLRSIFLVNDHIRSKTSFIEFLNNVERTLNEIHTVMRQMFHKCKPLVFWSCIRIYLGGYNADNGLPNGLHVDGTDLAFEFNGGSGAQSTLIHAIDTFFNIDHGVQHATDFLASQRVYMPIKHQEYLNNLARIYSNNYLKTKVCEFNDPDIMIAYNNAVDALVRFRQTHYNIVHTYITRHINASKSNAQIATVLEANNIHGTKGSGGLAIPQLVDFIRDTQNTRISDIYIRSRRIICFITRWYVWLGIAIAIWVFFN